MRTSPVRTQATARLRISGSFTVGVSAGAGLALGRVSLEAIYNQGLTEIAHDFGSSNVWWLTVGMPVWTW